MKGDIKVSVCCFTYNQANYIKDALDGFLMQKTDFFYEILVHDDASNDGTTEIIKGYAEKYPGRFRLSLERENQYSKGWRACRHLLDMAPQGKYMALCEGDDFWIYDRKLQAQYDFMEGHPEVSACYHNALIYQEDTDGLTLNVNGHPSGYIEDRDVVCTTKGWYPTASTFLRSEYLPELPGFTCPTGDEVLRDYMACKGKLYYMNRAWSVYRAFAKNGWNTRYQLDKKLAAEHFADTVDYFAQFNEYSGGRFSRFIRSRLFSGVFKYKDAHYGRECRTSEFEACMDDLKDVTGHKVDGVLNEYARLYIIQCSDYYEHTVRKKLEGLVKNGKMLCIYGAGTEALKALAVLGMHHINVACFIVTKKKDGNDKVLNIPIYGINEITPDRDRLIWPCLILGREEVLHTLSKGEYGCVVV